MPFCCSGSENAGMEDHSGSGVSMGVSPTGDLTSGMGLGLPTGSVTGLKHFFPPLLVASYLEVDAPQPN